KHAAKPPSGLDPPFSGVWRSSPAPKMIFLSSFIYGCSSWWFLGCSPATSLPHQVLWFWLGIVNWRFRYVEFGFVVLVTASLTLSCACMGFRKSSGCFND
ncbi:unnamed protein product, partial [Brassica napus]